MNATTWLGPLDIVQPLFGYVMPFLMMVTLMSNTIIIIVLSQHIMSSPTNTVLMSMAVCDLLTILLPGPWYIYLYMFDGHTSMDWNLTTCYMFEFSLETTPQIFHTASNWLTLTLATQRYIYVCHPSSAREMCTVRSSRWVVTAVVATAILHQLPRMLDRHYGILDPIDGNNIVFLFTQHISDIMYVGFGEHVCFVSFGSVPSIVGIDLYFFLFFW